MHFKESADFSYYVTEIRDENVSVQFLSENDLQKISKQICEYKVQFYLKLHVNAIRPRRKMLVQGKCYKSDHFAKANYFKLLVHRRIHRMH